MGRETGGGVGRVELGVHGARKNTKRARRLLVETAEGIREASHEDLLAGMVKRAATEAIRDAPPPMVRCARCGVPVKTNGSSRKKWCLRCKQYGTARRWQKKNPDKVAEAARKRRERDPDGEAARLRAANARYRATSAGKAAHAAAERKRYQANRERIIEMARLYRAKMMADPEEAERIRERDRAARAKRKAKANAKR